MDEEKQEEKQKEREGETTENSNSGSEQETTPLIDEANAAAERLEKANKKQEELLRRQEILMAKQTLGGRAEAGQEAKQKEETDSEYRKRIEKEIAEGKYQ